jgi:type I restriction enzyme M protein
MPTMYQPSTPELKAILNASASATRSRYLHGQGQPEADAGLRDNENVPLGESVYDYFEREVKPHVPDAWIDESKRMNRTAKSASSV